MARLVHNVRKSRQVVNPEDLILRPHITEKATDETARGVYTFLISPRADKLQVIGAIETLFKVKPYKVNIVNRKTRKIVKRGRGSRKITGHKKAIVYLREGDKIEFV